MRIARAKRLLLAKAASHLIVRVACAWFLAQAVLTCPCSGLAGQEATVQESPPSNEEFLRESIRSLVTGTFADFPHSSSGLLLLRAEGEHPANWLVEDELVFCLRPLDYEIALYTNEPKNNLQESRLLFYRIIEMSLSYPQIKRKGFLGGRMVTRKSMLNLSFRLEDGVTRKVVWAERGKQERSDIIKRSMIESVNNESYPFLSPPLPNDPQSRFVEPALVAAVVGGLIYLFFANR